MTRILTFSYGHDWKMSSNTSLVVYHWIRQTSAVFLLLYLTLNVVGIKTNESSHHEATGISTWLLVFRFLDQQILFFIFTFINIVLFFFFFSFVHQSSLYFIDYVTHTHTQSSSIVCMEDYLLNIHLTSSNVIHTVPVNRLGSFQAFSFICKKCSTLCKAVIKANGGYFEQSQIYKMYFN